MLRGSRNNFELKVDGGGEKGSRQQLLRSNSNDPGATMQNILSPISKLESQSATRPGVSFHPAIKKEFGGKRPRMEEGLDGKRLKMEETEAGVDLVEVKKEETDSREYAIVDQEKLQGTKIELEGNLEERKPRFEIASFLPH